MHAILLTNFCGESHIQNSNNKTTVISVIARTENPNMDKLRELISKVHIKTKAWLK
jgi:hypothetical protein